VLVGIEATGHTRWFERMLAELRHELWIGDAAQIRASMVRKQKTDTRDAAHVLQLLVAHPSTSESPNKQVKPRVPHPSIVCLGGGFRHCLPHRQLPL